MSMSTQSGGGSRRPSATKAVAGGKPNLAKDTDTSESETPAKKTAASKKATASKKAAPASKSTTAGKSTTASKSAAAAKRTTPAKKGARPATKSGLTGGRKPITPVRVSQGRNWGPVVLFAVTILVAVGIIGFAGYKVWDSGLTVSDRVGRIDGVSNFRKTDKALVKGQQHKAGPLTYAQNPPVAGPHNPDWMNCMGDVYDAPIAKEHAVHALEHGAVWLVYNPSKVDAAGVEKLKAKISGKEYSFMSPMPDLDSAVSLQAWGFQLKVNDVNDKRIDEFIKVTRKNATVEAGAVCSGGITETGTTPRDLQSDQPAGQQGGNGTTGG
ncbi:hypothetical protein Val02_57630 [Virgisporangium aliadipatigenens]|uniref:DUF3105 domain-containing protein n=2 Tax=Virgisporangium aliadipatigenens TaxID=741659 RepID=A0A8J3YR00_9ACTN|nr:hypothetical protein Val02_57630 [Virgisporangium aliadipatigenens]